MASIIEQQTEPLDALQDVVDGAAEEVQSAKEEVHEARESQKKMVKKKAPMAGAGICAVAGGPLAPKRAHACCHLSVRLPRSFDSL